MKHYEIAAMALGCGEEDPEPSAVDRGPGLPTYNAKNGERMVEATEAQVADTVKRIRATDRGPGPLTPEERALKLGELLGLDRHRGAIADEIAAAIKASQTAPTEVILPPEVLAQLQRIEDRLLGVEVFLAKIWATVAPAPKNEVIRPPMILGDDDYDDDEL